MTMFQETPTSLSLVSAAVDPYLEDLKDKGAVGVKHLKGKHNQAAHGGGGGVASVSSSERSAMISKAVSGKTVTIKNKRGGSASVSRDAPGGQYSLRSGQSHKTYPKAHRAIDGALGELGIPITMK